MDDVHRKAMRVFALLDGIDPSLKGEIALARSLYNKAITVAAEKINATGRGMGSSLKREILMREISDFGAVDSIYSTISKANPDTLSKELLELLEDIVQSNPGPDAPKFCPDCGYRLDISEDLLFLVCHVCSGMMEVGDMNTGSHERLPKTKVGTFKPNRHLKQWMDRIFARNAPESLTEEVIERIRRGCVAKRLTMEMGVEDLRAVLREQKLTTYNGDVPYILQKITKRGPPNVSPEIVSKVTSLFIEIMEIRGDVKKDGRTNRIYYPYYLYKLFDIYLERPEEREILEFIHLHATETLSSNDEEWRSICLMVPALRGKYRPTVLKIGNCRR